VDHGRHERPRIGAELRDRDRDEHAERREQRPGTKSAHVSSMASFRDSMYEAATATASHVTGSSKNPLYASEWTNKARNTAPSPSRGRRAAAHLLDQDRRASEQREIGGETDHAELGRDRERGRVRDEARGRPALLRAGLAGDRLAAEADADDRMRPEHLPGQLDAPRAVAREATRGVIARRGREDPGGADEHDHRGERRDELEAPPPGDCGEPSVTTKSAAMLDCEYENQSPTKRNAISPAARNGFTFR
jgi:hypothetical protein